MKKKIETKKVLVTVKTYPYPSTSEHIKESVCTAGLDERGNWIRLYPTNYRYRDGSEHYEKYDWIEVSAYRAKGDLRPESWTPDPNTPISIVGHLDHNRDGWKQRSQIVLPSLNHTMCELNSLRSKHISDRPSLALIKPFKVIDFIDTPDDDCWPPQIEAAFKQMNVFGEERKPLEKIPFKFSFKYLCSPECTTPHTQMITDWELSESFRKWRHRYNTTNLTIEKIRQKYYDEFCGEKYETHFFVGTTLRHHYSWIILGMFNQPKRLLSYINQQELDFS